MKIAVVNSLWNKRKELSFYLLIFLVSKASVFLAPLVLSNYLSLSQYGALEYGIAIGNILAMIIGFGLPNSYPYFILKKRESGYFSSFLLYIIIVFGLSISLILIFLLHNSQYTEPLYWAALMALIITVQTFFSSIYKTHNKPIFAVLIDGGFYIFLLGVSGVTILLKINGNFDYIFYDLLGYFILFTSVLLLFFRKRIRFSGETFSGLYKILRFGFPLIITSFLIMLLSNSARILVEKYFTSADLAHYSFYFRIASGVVLFHQFASIVYFKQLFISDYKKIDRYFAIFFMLLTTITLCGFYLVPILFTNTFKLLKDIDDYREIYFIMVNLVIFWIALALNEPLIYRENLAVKMNILIAVSLLIVGIVFYILMQNNQITLISIVKLHFITLFFVVEAQFFALRKKNVYLNKSRYGLMALFFLTFLIDFLCF